MTMKASDQFEPTVFVIFGGGGGLTWRKLVPALFDLSQDRSMPADFSVIAVERAPMSDEKLRQRLHNGVNQFSRFGKGRTPPEINSPSTSATNRVISKSRRPMRLWASNAPDWKRNGAPKLIASFTWPPAEHVRKIPKYLGKAGLARDREWARIVVEKPIGYDLESALALNAILAANFEESQIFRIDHYLGKETVQNILAFRFANPLFEPIWNRRYIDYVTITVAEAVASSTAVAITTRGGAPRYGAESSDATALFRGHGADGFVPSRRIRNKKVDMRFGYHASFDAPSPDAYKTLLWDIMKNDGTLFMRANQVEAAWQWLMPVLNVWRRRRPVTSPTTPPALGDLRGSGPVRSRSELAVAHRAGGTRESQDETQTSFTCMKEARPTIRRASGAIGNTRPSCLTPIWCWFAVRRQIWEEIPGLTARGYPLKTVTDAIVMGNDLIGNFGRPPRLRPNAKRASGCSLWWSLAADSAGVKSRGIFRIRSHTAHRFYPELRNQPPRIVLLQKGESLLPELHHKSLSEFKLRKLRQNGIEVRLETWPKRLIQLRYIWLVSESRPV